MNLKDAFEFKNKYKNKVIGQKFVSSDGSTSDGFNITDVLVSPINDLGKIMLAMLQHDLSNEQAIPFINSPTKDYEVYLISDISGNNTFTIRTTLTQHLERTNQF